MSCDAKDTKASQSSFIWVATLALKPSYVTGFASSLTIALASRKVAAVKSAPA